MKNQTWTEFINYQEVLEAIDNYGKYGIVGAVGSFKSILINQLLNQHKQILFILKNKEEAAYFYNDFESLNQDSEVNCAFFPSTRKKAYQESKNTPENIQYRSEVLSLLSNSSKKQIILSYPEACMERVLQQKQLKKQILELKVGEECPIDFINETLLTYHFNSVDFVYEPGQFAIRGGIVDIYSFGSEHPYRIEFFDDEIESIRTFDPGNQLSLNPCKHLKIVPNTDDVAYEKSASIFEYFEQGLIVINDFAGFNHSIQEFMTQAQSEHQHHDLQKKPSELYLNKLEIRNLLEHHKVLEFANPKLIYAEEYQSYNIKIQPHINKNFELLHQQFKDLDQKSCAIYITARQSKQIERVYQIFEDHEWPTPFHGQICNLHEGFIAEDLNFAVFTDHQIFDRFHRFELRETQKNAKQALTLKELFNLQKGDYVVHIDHGVGQFSGLQKVDVNGTMQEAIRLVYKGGDVLYVSIHSLHRISKFTGKDGSVPKVHKLGSKVWEKTKNKAKSRIKELAFDLIKLYAERKKSKGYQYSPDGYLQNELEASFMFEDTPDQIKATADFKKDMESESPMDRLICGDVGFGKTEIAMRAAFKAATDGKQVAILVPTTILSYQHFKSFTKRFKDFPVTVDYINRFKTAKQSKDTLQRLKEGKIDIIIGTHKLTSKNIEFKDLGLLIIDEEQKFGVSVKDKLKTLRANLDTLTLTATPIPRTLQFSMMGARDLSIINTPPPNRQPVSTELITWNEDKIKSVIEYELAREGQVYFIHNRVQNIHEVKNHLQRLVPKAKIAVGHGQMDGDQLEHVLVEFMEGNFDILLATTIIENGIDVSNANTILINHAENFGLSDLHQMRGRVGRSSKKGFCYLMAPQMHEISEDSRKRLEAICYFSDLGSGFQIAMRDLDIRGAGDLLGGEQSGFISDIGYEMYQKILNEAIRELRNEEFKELDSEMPEHLLQGEYVEDCIFETDLPLHIPDYYINDVNERLAIYQRLESSKSESDLISFEKDITDRFGPIPNATKGLIETINIRTIAKKLAIQKLVLKNQKAIATFVGDTQSPFYQSDTFQNIIIQTQQNPGKIKLSEKNNQFRMTIPNVSSVFDVLSTLQSFLK